MAPELPQLKPIVYLPEKAAVKLYAQVLTALAVCCDDHGMLFPVKAKLDEAALRGEAQQLLSSQCEYQVVIVRDQRVWDKVLSEAIKKLEQRSR